MPHIICLAKQVPDPETPASQFRVDEAAKKVLPAPGIQPVPSQFDTIGVEAALRIKDKQPDTVITILSLGPDSFRDTANAWPGKPRKPKTLIPVELLDYYRPVYEVMKRLRDSGRSLTEILVEIGVAGFRTRTSKRFRHTSQLCKIFRSFERRPGGGATPR